MMLAYCLIVHFVLNVFGTGNTRAQGPEDFRLTKYLDIRIDGKYGSIHPDLRDIIRSQVLSDIEDRFQEHHSLDGNTQERCSEICLKEILKKNMNNSIHGIVDNFLENYNFKPILSRMKNMSNLGFLSAYDSEMDVNTKICQAAVGVDKLPICQIAMEKNIHSKNSTKKPLPTSCKEIFTNGQTVSGIYEIQPKLSQKPFNVLCDMETKGGGWTHIQKRVDGLQDFYLGWREYKFGFGNLKGEFWIGLENIRALTGSEINELLVEIVDRDNVHAFAQYKAFKVGAETEGYPLKVLSGFSGDAGDSLVDHLGSKFTTKDFDQDKHGSNCAEMFSGAWWYSSCHVSNLNGKYLNVDLPAQYKYHGLHWKTFRSHEYCHARARMLVRPAGN